MGNDHYKKISKFISLVLRHNPDAAGISLDDHGWADVKELIQGVNETGRALDLETLKEIKAMDPGATVVMCSAMGQETMVMDSIKSGAKDFIVKPFKPERILSTVKKILG